MPAMFDRKNGSHRGTALPSRIDMPIEQPIDQEERQTLIAHGRNKGLDEASHLCGRMAYNTVPASNTSYRRRRINKAICS
jgi:hypothetical protein